MVASASSGLGQGTDSNKIGLHSGLPEPRDGVPGAERAAILGTGAISQAVAREILGSPQCGLEFSGFFDATSASRRTARRNSHAVRGDLRSLIAQCRNGEVDRVYVPLPTLSARRTREIVEQLADTNAGVFLVPDPSTAGLLHARLQSVGDICTLSIFETPLKGLGGYAKRVLDIVVGCLILGLVAVPMLLIALGVRLSSPGPIIFKQRRYGLDGHKIEVWKFRTMTVTENGDTITQAYDGDPRITRLGHFLRRTYLDELPQFFNVLAGTMSIVGPRPHAAAHNEEYRRLIPFYMLRQRVRPGITGWAQANGWSGRTELLEKMERRVEHDLWYIRNWSIWLDLKILARTALLVLKTVLKPPVIHGTAAVSAAVGVLMLVENLPVPLDRRVWLEALSLRDRGYEVSIVCPRMYGHTAPHERIEGIDIHRYPPLWQSDGAFGYALEYGTALVQMSRLAWKIWAQGRVDVIHVANPPDLLALAALPFRLLGKRLVYDQHDLCPELYAAKGGSNSLLARLLRRFEGMSYRMADAVVVPNQQYRDIALSRGGKDPDSVFVVRNGPRRHALAPRPGVAVERLVGYVGVMGDQDGLDVLLDAAALLRDRYPDLRYVLLGDGSHRSQFEDYADRLGLTDRVRFTGMVDESRIAEELAPCALCVVPDPINPFTANSTMNKVMEYMALAKPIVQFDSPPGRFSAQSAALHARPNDVSDFSDKIAQLIDDPALARRMGQRGRGRFLRCLHWEHSIPALYRAYDRALGVAAAPADRAAAMPRQVSGRAAVGAVARLPARQGEVPAKPVVTPAIAEQGFGPGTDASPDCP